MPEFQLISIEMLFSVRRRYAVCRLSVGGPRYWKRRSLKALTTITKSEATIARAAIIG